MHTRPTPVQVRDDLPVARLVRRIRRADIGFSRLWPQTSVVTTAVSNSADGEAMMAASRSPEIMADSAVAILSRTPSDVNSQCYLDVDVLAAEGVDDLSRYGGGPNPILGIFEDR